MISPFSADIQRVVVTDVSFWRNDSTSRRLFFFSLKCRIPAATVYDQDGADLADNNRGFLQTFETGLSLSVLHRCRSFTPPYCDTVIPSIHLQHLALFISLSVPFLSGGVEPLSFGPSLMEKIAVAGSGQIGGWLLRKIPLPLRPIITPSLTRKILSPPLCFCPSVSVDGCELWVLFQFCLRSRKQPTQWLM